MIEQRNHPQRFLTLLVSGLAILACMAPQPSRAQLQVDITSGVSAPIPIAVEDFPGDPRTSAEVVRQDLGRSGRFLLGTRTAVDYLLAGRASAAEDGRITIDFELTNLLTGQRLLVERVSAAPSAWRNAAHRISDRVYQKIIGARSAFATRIAYVSVDGEPPAQRYQLIVADADGENPKIILQSRLPLMSPAWSPDGEWLAYVSFETRTAGVYVQRVRTAERRRVSGRAGVNNAPAWSPDGRRLALTLSSPNGNLDVHVLEIDSGELLRITDHPAIDTEPAWSPDGSQIYFTSDRAGGPQVYRASVAAAARVQRVTFLGNYNARPRISPDGKQLAFVTREEGAYRVAIQDLGNGGVRVLSKGRQDESPGFSPDGGTLIHAARERGQGVLATVSADGLIQSRLKADRGDVREPAWGPFLP
ncbi:MAG: Tol-Pal system beta propeller repeat protein TolB [Gammaproteobacteria bacterium]|nr:Tol-Pal system beta propeller repeat protein TolB [Gammaproteobacteria bacterium]